MKLKSFLILILLLCFAWGCGDEGVLLEGLVPSAPAALPDVGPVPQDIRDMIWGKDIDTLMAELEDAIDSDRDDEFVKWTLHRICYRRAREAYYTKYINAGGVAIMGNGHLDDRLFYAARDVVLGMTFKRPELREVLSPSREFRPGATLLPGIHDVTKQITPDRRFRIILNHNDMDYASVPEVQFGGGLNYRVAPGGGLFNGEYIWAYVGGYDHLEEIYLWSVICHEVAHAIHYAIRLIDPTFEDRLQEAYNAAKASGISVFNNHRALRDGLSEYWAYSAQEWFERFGSPLLHDSFRRTDPLIYALLEEWFDPINLSLVDSRIYE